MLLSAPSSVLSQQHERVRQDEHSVGRFAVVDAHVDATPESVERSVATLAAYLAEAGPDDLTRARAIYRWVAGNVEYDTEGLITGNHGDLSPSGVLRRRSAVCSGYALLAATLGDALGLDVEVVTGWSKGYGYTAGQEFAAPPNHAWNAIRIDGAWRLMDPTWGAGYLDNQTQFTRHFQEHYFLTEPGAFVLDHLPENDRWQLLDQPISAAEYADLVYVQPTFFTTGLRIDSHERVHIETEGRIAVTLGVSKPILLTARIVDADQNRTLDDMAFVQVSEREATVHAAFPHPGDYLLRLFARPLAAEGSLDWVLDYRVSASGGLPDARFPTAMETFGANGVWLVEPLEGVLNAGQIYSFRLRVPGALSVASVASGEWTHFTAEGNEFSAEVTAVPGSILVCAQYHVEDNCKGLLRYTGR